MVASTTADVLKQVHFILFYHAICVFFVGLFLAAHLHKRYDCRSQRESGLRKEVTFARQRYDSRELYQGLYRYFLLLS